jgi:hypothetical protein
MLKLSIGKRPYGASHPREIPRRGGPRARCFHRPRRPERCLCRELKDARHGGRNYMSYTLKTRAPLLSACRPGQPRSSRRGSSWSSNVPCPPPPAVPAQRAWAW